MTTEELLALPEDGIDRWLIRGELRERPKTFRDRWHSGAMAQLGACLGDWLHQQPRPRGELLGGIVGCRLERDPDTTLCLDLVYLSPDQAAVESDKTQLVPCAPTLAVEIVAVDDTTEEIQDQVRVCLRAGVPLVWVVYPKLRTVAVHQPGAERELYHVGQELSGDPHLPGLRLRVESIFSRG